MINDVAKQTKTRFLFLIISYLESFFAQKKRRRKNCTINLDWQIGNIFGNALKVYF